MTIKSVYTPILLSGLFMLSACSNSAEDIQAVTYSGGDYPLNEQRHATIIYSDSAVNILEIDAGLMQDYGNKKPPYMFFGNGLKVHFYNGPNVNSTVLTSDTARQNKESGLWSIGGNVVVLNGKGERMSTELLFWDKEEERLYTDHEVVIETDGQYIKGIGFEADQEFNNYRIFKVQGEITIDDE